jgi:hypothetical protein
LGEIGAVTGLAVAAALQVVDGIALKAIDLLQINENWTFEILGMLGLEP